MIRRPPGLLSLLSLLLAASAAAQPADLQDPFRVPQDARELFDRQRQLAAEEPLWETEAARFLVHYPCGALVEAQAAVDSLQRLDPGNPDAERFQLQLNSHRPARIDRTLEEAGAFLERYRDSPRVPEAQLASVARLRDWLVTEQGRRARMEASTRTARWAPAGALLLLAVLVGLHFRTTRGE